MKKLTVKSVLLSGVIVLGAAASALAQSQITTPIQSSGSVKQIAPGTTGGIALGKTVGPADPVSQKKLAAALSKETRQTLQEAMDSARAADSAPATKPAK